jgi:hypothetical protein
VGRLRECAVQAHTGGGAVQAPPGPERPSEGRRVQRRARGLTRPNEEPEVSVQRAAGGKEGFAGVSLGLTPIEESFSIRPGLQSLTKKGGE